ncbi:SusC/RagA family TonB-linked outer membrane protein [Chitinophaga sp. 22321]|uniref:SusC/RagA family TonB-linked outer membrane protein n=1 Tax=Chitinophaga hostae TaxID=2831022 RepID=A0ABS5IXW0_9BACT|nr:TonB-dependent receptor [Chitinophaga hostae]MBS0027621.1 SusC/RagA family TonB-linked outer membrane protein [Chitinophaga hostae]
MKVTAFLVLFACTQAVARTSNGQSITLSVKDAPAKEVFREIQKQSGKSLMVSEAVLSRIGKLTLHIKDQALEKVLERCLQKDRFTYTNVDGVIVITEKPEMVPPTDLAPAVDTSGFVVTGKIVDAAGNPLPGASVSRAGTRDGAAADAGGNFRLKVPSGTATLVISYIGYQPLHLEVSHAGFHTIVLKPADAKVDEVVVVGYGTQKKASLTSAISSIDTKDMMSIPAANLSNVLAGRASGTFVQSGSGVPGKSSIVRIRSSSSWNSSGPLIVIDGVARDQATFDALDPNQVQSITILKDAASAAIYGSRSSDGVLLVTTKTGKAGKAMVQFSSLFGVYSKPEIDVKYLSMDESMDLYNSTHTGTADFRFNQYDRDWIHKNNPEGNLHYDEAYQHPFTQRHSLNVSGGTDRVAYFIGGTFYDEKGFLPQLGYQKYNLRSNVQVAITKDLSLGLNLSYNKGGRSRFYTIEGKDDDLSGFYEKLKYIMPPTTFAYIDGKPMSPTWVSNPIELMKNGGYLHVNKQYIDGIINLEYKVPFIKGLTLKGVADLYNGNDFSKAYAIQPLLYQFKLDPKSGIQQLYTNEIIGTKVATAPAQPFIGNENGRTSSYQINAIASYDKHFGNHNLNIVGVYEQSDGYYNYSSIYKYNFPVNTTDQFPFASQASGDTKANGFETYLDARVSYVGRVNYDYQHKYLVSASLRADGSSKFSKDNRWGYFPAASLGWVMSEEPFLANLKKKGLDMLKIRASYGSTGNDNIPAWLFKEIYNASSTPFYLGDPGSSKSILAYNGIAQTNYTWEGAKSYNAGVDLNFKQHWSVVADVWTKNTFNILGQRILAIPVEFGASYPIENYGRMNAKGMDLELGYLDGKIGKDFLFDVKANFGLATTNVLKKDKALGATPADDPVGKPLNYQAGYDAIGILRTDADVNALPAGYTIFGAAPAKGMMNFTDVGGPDGKPDGRIDSYDKVVVAKYSNAVVPGSSNQSNNAPIAYGLSISMGYKNFRLSMLLAGLAGYKVIYNDPWGRNGGNIPYPAYYGDSWSETNPNGKFPKLYNASGNQRQDYSVVSALNTFSGDFLRLKNLNLSYDLSPALLKRAGLSSAQVFAGATNLFCLRKFKLYDPEVYSFGSYPIMTNVSLGFNVQF